MYPKTVAVFLVALAVAVLAELNCAPKYSGKLQTLRYNTSEVRGVTTVNTKHNGTVLTEGGSDESGMEVTFSECKGREFFYVGMGRFEAEDNKCLTQYYPSNTNVRVLALSECEKDSNKLVEKQLFYGPYYQGRENVTIHAKTTNASASTVAYPYGIYVAATDHWLGLSSNSVDGFDVQVGGIKKSSP